MAKREKTVNVVSLMALSRDTKITYFRLYDYFVNNKENLSLEEKKTLCNSFHDQSLDFFKRLGFYLKIHPIKDQG